MRAEQRPRRAIRSRTGRIPYAYVAVVALACMLVLTSYFEYAVTFKNTATSYDLPEEDEAALRTAEQLVSQSAYFDLMRAEATLLVNYTNPDLAWLNDNVSTAFAQSLQSLGLLTPGGFQTGSVTIFADAWGVNVTWDQADVMDTTSHTSIESGAQDPNLPVVQQVNPASAVTYGQTRENVYPMVVGYVTYTAFDSSTGVNVIETVPFSQVLTSDLGLLESKSAQFGDAAWGPDGGFAQLVQYLVTTLGELRALSGYGAGGWPGPQSQTEIASGTIPSSPSILSADDIHDAVNLALLLQSLQYFRSFDANATTAFLNQLPPGAYQALLDEYVTNGTVDVAALFLLLLNQNGGWSDGVISSGEGLAQAIESFSDRYKFDLLDHYWGADVVDPTLTDPVVNWATVDTQSQGYMITMLTQYLQDYQSWLGIRSTGIPALGYTAQIAPESSSSPNGDCTYTIFPGGQIQVTSPGVPNLAALILGTDTSETITLANGQPVTIEMAPTLYAMFQNVTINNYAGAPVATSWGDFDGAESAAGYWVTPKSLLAEYSPAASGTDPAVYSAAVNEIITDLSASMSEKSADPNDTSSAGYLDYVGIQGLHDGTNETLVQAGLPDLSTPAGINEALNTSFSLLTNGTNPLFTGPFAQALQAFAAQATNSATVDNWWTQGAVHPTAVAGDVKPYPTSWNGATMQVDYNISDIARMAAQLWFEEMYTLYYGSSGVIPAAPIGAISQGPMDASQYNVIGPGVETSPPVTFHEPDFAINVMNETYISAMCWMDPGIDPGFSGCDTESGGGSCVGGGGFLGVCGAYANTAGAYDSHYASNPADAADCNAAYAAAKVHWYDINTGGYLNTWSNIANATEAALQGTPTSPGIDTIHDQSEPWNISSSWWAVKNSTGNADFSGTNFTQWIQNYIAPPILADTDSMGVTGGWLSQLYNVTQQWIGEAANVTGVIDKPFLDNDRPYSFYLGNESQAAAGQQLFNESLQTGSAGLSLGTTGLTLQWSGPGVTVHLVDPQDQASNMGIAPFESSWSIDISGELAMTLTSQRVSLGYGGSLHPTVLNLSVPIDVATNATIITPWPLGSGWDPTTVPLPGDPAMVQTRALLGLDGKDLHASPHFLPGTYVSPTLDNLIENLSAVSRFGQAEGLDLGNLMAGFPDRAVGASAGWTQNLTTLENTTAADLSATSTGAYMATVRADFLTMDNAFAAAGAGPYCNTPVAADNALLGFNAILDTAADSVTLFQNSAAASFCGNIGTAANPSLEYDYDFAGTQVGYGFTVDQPTPGPGGPLHGFNGGWGTTSPVSYFLNAQWTSFGSPEQMTLNGPIPSPQVTATTTSLASLGVPYLNPNTVLPAVISAETTGPLPAAVVAAFKQSVSDWLPNTPAFNSYISQQTYEAGDLYNALVGPTPPTTAGVYSLGFSTELSTAPPGSPGATATYGIAVLDPNGLFGSAAEMANLESFLLWDESNSRSLSYGLGAASLDPSTYWNANPYLMTSVYRNVTLSSGPLGAPDTYAWMSPNLAASESDLAGTGGGAVDSPTILLGGGQVDGWGFTGTYT